MSQKDTQSKTLVIGHQRPDTDSAVAAAVYAQLLTATDASVEYEGVVLDDPGPQARWLFETAGLPLPRIIDGVHSTVADVARKGARSVTADAALGDAIRIITEDQISTVPVLDDDHRLAGILSDRLPNCNYFYHFNVEDFLGVLFELEDLVRTLRFDTWRASSKPASGKVTMEPESAGEGDVLLCGHDPQGIAAAAEQGAAAAVICTYRSEESWADEMSKAERIGIYRFKGSLLALCSQLSLCIPVGNAMATDHESLRPDQALQDIHSLVSHTSYPLPVIGADGTYVGLVSRADLLDAPKPKVILVDHFETHQAAPGIEDAEIVEIVDHHRVGTLETHSPIRVDCRPVGSTATIIARKFAELGLEPSAGQSRLMLGAMISDTLLLTSPTTTEVDRREAARLAEIAGVELEEFGKEVLVRNDETLVKSPEELIDKDLKEFSAGAIRFAVAQIETVDRTRLEIEKLNQFAAAISTRRNREGWDFLAVLITDVLRSDSLVFIDDAELRRGVYLAGDGRHFGPTTLWSGCVSRKKQFLPTLLKRLEEVSK